MGQEHSNCAVWYYATDKVCGNNTPENGEREVREAGQSGA